MPDRLTPAQIRQKLRARDWHVANVEALAAQEDRLAEERARSLGHIERLTAELEELRLALCVRSGGDGR